MKMQQIAIGKIKANEHNPRSFARDQDLEDLGRSIEAHGIIEPLIVRKHPAEAGCFEVLAGHRRLMAAEGILEELPCVVREEQGDGMVLAIVENTQRVDLTPFETAQAIDRAAKGIKQKDLAAAIGRSATYVSKFLTIMKAARKIAAKGEDPEYFADYGNMEELYLHAKEIVSGKQKGLDLGDECEGGDGEDGEQAGELSDIEALRKAIDEQAKAAKVKLVTPAGIEEATDEGKHILAQLEFKSIRDAEKFFLSFTLSKAK